MLDKIFLFCYYTLATKKWFFDNRIKGIVELTLKFMVKLLRAYGGYLGA